MKGLLIRWILLAGSIMAASYLLEGIEIRNFISALGAAAVLGILNVVLRPVLLVLTLPINILSFGLFTLIINSFLLKMASGVISGFEVHGFWPALWGALVITIVNWLLHSLISDRGRVEYIDLRQRRTGKWE